MQDIALLSYKKAKKASSISLNWMLFKIVCIFRIFILFKADLPFRYADLVLFFNLAGSA
jgi:hypothetical protein